MYDIVKATSYPFSIIYAHLKDKLFICGAPGFAKFISKIASFQKEQLIIGLESTGIYSENLICFLFDSGYKLDESNGGLLSS